MTALHQTVAAVYGDLTGVGTHIDGADPKELDVVQRTAVVHCTRVFVELRSDTGKAHHRCLS